MTAISISDRYAHCLYESAGNEVEAVYEDSLWLLSYHMQSTTFRKFWKSPLYSSTRKQHIMEKMMVEQLSPPMLRFLAFLLHKKRHRCLTAILQQFILRYKSKHGLLPARIHTATPLSADLHQRVVALIAKLMPHHTIDLEAIINPELLGGYIIEVAGKKIDQSIRGRLDSLRSVWLAT